MQDYIKIGAHGLIGTLEALNGLVLGTEKTHGWIDPELGFARGE